MIAKTLTLMAWTLMLIFGLYTLWFNAIAPTFAVLDFSWFTIILAIAGLLAMLIIFAVLWFPVLIWWTK